MLVTAGEVHLERCLYDLRERFSSEVDGLIVSEPIIPFQETIVRRPKLDRLNELIEQTPSDADGRVVETRTANRLCTFRLRAIALTPDIVNCLLRNDRLLTEVELRQKGTEDGAILGQKALNLEAETREKMRKFRKEMLTAFETSWKRCRNEAGHFWGDSDVGTVLKMVDQIWAFGPKKARSNLLFNLVPEYQKRPCVWSYLCGATSEDQTASAVRDFDQSIVTGFRLRCMAGPLCEEPIRGVGFLIDQWTLASETETADNYGPLSGQIIATVKEGCKQAFEAQPQRLVAAMYSCMIQATSEVLGKVYAVLSRRKGTVSSYSLEKLLEAGQGWLFARCWQMR